MNGPSLFVILITSLAPLVLTGSLVLAGIPVAHATFATVLSLTAIITMVDIAHVRRRRGRP